jgi:hypothetical protein|tara:strand:+ start:11060 stop:11254 length:195 start_codon:yes stop_codon:yes gene_type:complete
MSKKSYFAEFLKDNGWLYLKANETLLIGDLMEILPAFGKITMTKLHDMILLEETDLLERKKITD